MSPLPSPSHGYTPRRRRSRFLPALVLAVSLALVIWAWWLMREEI